MHFAATHNRELGGIGTLHRVASDADGAPIDGVCLTRAGDGKAMAGERDGLTRSGSSSIMSPCYATSG